MPTIQIESDQLINAARQMPEGELRQLIDQLTRLELEKNGASLAEGEAEQLPRPDQGQPPVSTVQSNIANTASTFTLLAEDDWERLVLEMGTDCGVSLSDQALCSEGIYE